MDFRRLLAVAYYVFSRSITETWQMSARHTWEWRLVTCATVGEVEKWQFLGYVQDLYKIDGLIENRPQLYSL